MNKKEEIAKRVAILKRQDMEEKKANTKIKRALRTIKATLDSME